MYSLDARLNSRRPICVQAVWEGNCKLPYLDEINVFKWDVAEGWSPVDPKCGTSECREQSAHSKVQNPVPWSRLVFCTFHGFAGEANHSPMPFRLFDTFRERGVEGTREDVKASAIVYWTVREALHNVMKWESLTIEILDVRLYNVQTLDKLGAL